MSEAWLGPVGLYLGKGFLLTLKISVLSILLATPLGILVGTLATSPNKWLVAVGRIYVELLRGVPSLMTLLFVFFALPRLGIETSPITASVLGLGLWSSANIAEAMRGALGSISSDQAVSGRALGMTNFQTLIWVVLPQALRRFLPPYVGQLTFLIQASTLTSVVGVNELLGSSRQMIERLAYSTGDSHAILLYGMVLAGFFAVCYPMTVIVEYLERRAH
ncbi:MAG: amino acid transporter permease [Microvirga sp.]|jgi:polar amino acid transport system permease protein|nr:amino acid transporter permease [Microvirga sp.]